MAEGVLYALEDRAHLHVEIWRPVVVCRSPEDPATIELFDQLGRIIDEPSIGTPQGKQSFESFVEEFAENSNGFYRPPVLKRAPRDRTSRSLEASPAKEASESTGKAVQEGDQEHRDVTGQEHQERTPSQEEDKPQTLSDGGNAGMLLGRPDEFIFDRQAPAYFSHVARPFKRCKSTKTRSNKEMAYKEKTFSFGDIVKPTDRGQERAAVVRVIYKPKMATGARGDQVRKVLLLLDGRTWLTYASVRKLNVSSVVAKLGACSLEPTSSISHCSKSCGKCGGGSSKRKKSSATPLVSDSIDLMEDELRDSWYEDGHEEFDMDYDMTRTFNTSRDVGRGQVSKRASEQRDSRMTGQHLNQTKEIQREKPAPSFHAQMETKDSYRGSSNSRAAVDTSRMPAAADRKRSTEPH
ncbi:MAG: hypothetical protein SGPRY_013606, partial [Prymnesium sp.]